MGGLGVRDRRPVVRANLLPDFRGRRMEKITPDDIGQWRESSSTSAAPADAPPTSA